MSTEWAVSTSRYRRLHLCLQADCRGGSLAMESVADLKWNTYIKACSS